MNETLFEQMRPFMFPYFVEPVKPSLEPIQRKIKTTTTEKKALTLPLFWIFYILHYGWDKYQEPDTTRFANETQEKFHWIEVLREKKKAIKQHVKICSTDCEDELASKPRIGIATFLALCAAASLNVLVVQGRTYYQLKTSEDDDGDIKYHVILLEKDRYSWDKEADSKKIQAEYIRRVSWDKALKGIGAYSAQEIQELASKAQMPLSTTKKYTKKDMYEWLLQHI